MVVGLEVTESRFSLSMDDLWQKIARAVEIVSEGAAERLDGEGWKVYRVGTVIRIDLTGMYDPI
jgi:hypothetical protein